MAITLSNRFISELRAGVKTPNVIVEIELDGGTRMFGFHGRNTRPALFLNADGTHGADGDRSAIGSDELEPLMVVPAITNISSLENRLDPNAGYSTRGRFSFTITGRENFKPVVRDEYLKNRRVVRKDGFIARGLCYTDYATTFAGRITDWKRKGDALTIYVQDDLVDGSLSIPKENTTGTQHLDYTNSGDGVNPVDVMTDIILARLGVGAGYVDSDGFASERDLWLNSWRFSRVLTEPRRADEYLNELQRETNSFIVHDGEKVSFKVFAPPVPGTSVEQWSDDFDILDGTFTQDSGYREGFFNRVVLYYDYDESGSDRPENFESVVIALDAASQDATEWNEESTRTIKSRWIRSYSHTQPSTITGVVIYHASSGNGAGSGSIGFIYDGPGKGRLYWKPPGELPGPAVTVTRDGKFTLYGDNKAKWIRVLVDTSALPDFSFSEPVTIKRLDGGIFATALASKLLSRYRDPVSTVGFEVDMKNVEFEGSLVKPTDLRDITTAEASGPGSDGWTAERVMLTSVRPDFTSHRVEIRAIETRMYNRYGFIAPAGFPDYPSATSGQRTYGFIGDGTNKCGPGADKGYCVW